MTQYNTLTVKQANSQLNKLKPRIKTCPKVTMKISSNVVGNSNDENNFMHKLILTNTQGPSFVKLLQMTQQLI